MSLKARLKKLQAVILPPPDTLDIIAEYGRWLEAVKELRGMLTTPAARKSMLQFMVHKFVHLQFVMRDDPSVFNPLVVEARRYPAAVLKLFRAIPEHQRNPFALIINERMPRNWLHSLVMLRSCLPPGLHQNTMAALVDVYLHRGQDIDDNAMVCLPCGLLRPHRKSPPMSQWKLLPGREALVGPPPWYEPHPDFFEHCPHCQSTSWTWLSRVDETKHAWQPPAAKELSVSV